MNQLSIVARIAPSTSVVQFSLACIEQNVDFEPLKCSFWFVVSGCSCFFGHAKNEILCGIPALISCPWDRPVSTLSPRRQVSNSFVLFDFRCLSWEQFARHWTEPRKITDTFFFPPSFWLEEPLHIVLYPVFRLSLAKKRTVYFNTENVKSLKFNFFGIVMVFRLSLQFLVFMHHPKQKAKILLETIMGT